MNIKKILKIAVIGGAAGYILSNVYYQYGKGEALRIMKEANLTANEMLDLIKKHAAKLPLHERINIKIIETVATSKL